MSAEVLDSATTVGLRGGRGGLQCLHRQPLLTPQRGWQRPPLLRGDVAGSEGLRALEAHFGVDVEAKPQGSRPACTARCSCSSTMTPTGRYT
ncbi:uncharacterized protein J3R85_002950 [Psidium guajava]|nr:uncharacterized protein J3R85_002950 [Psidium guajava]